MSSKQIIDSSVRTAGRFSTLPARAYADVRLKAIDLQIFGVLAITESSDDINRRDGWFQVSQGLLAELSGVTRPTINKSIKRLAQASYLERKTSQTDSGAETACLYRIIFDADLPRQFDRWQGAASVKEAQKVAVKQENTPCKGEEQSHRNGENRGVKQRNTPCNSGEHPNANDGKHGVNERNRGVIEENTQQNIGVHGGLESTSSKEVKRVELESPEELIVETFLRLRKEHYPEIKKGLSARRKLIEQAASYLDRGLSVERFIQVLTVQISVTAKRGLEAPSGITRFKRDLDKAVRESNPYELPPISSAQRTSLKRAKPPDAVDERWVKVVDNLKDNEKLSCWLSLMKLGDVNQNTAVIHAPTELACRIAGQHSGDILAAVSASYGAIERLEIVKR